MTTYKSPKYKIGDTIVIKIKEDSLVMYETGIIIDMMGTDYPKTKTTTWQYCIDDLEWVDEKDIKEKLS